MIAALLSETQSKPLAYQRAKSLFLIGTVAAEIAKRWRVLGAGAGVPLDA